MFNLFASWKVYCEHLYGTPNIHQTRHKHKLVFHPIQSAKGLSLINWKWSTDHFLLSNQRTPQFLRKTKTLPNGFIGIWNLSNLSGMYFHNFKLTYEDYLDTSILNYYVKTKMYKGVLKFFKLCLLQNVNFTVAAPLKTKLMEIF